MAEWLPLLAAVVSVVAVLGGVAVGLWTARAQERAASRRTSWAEPGTLSAFQDGAPKVSDPFAEELRAEKLRLYSRVLHENGKPIEALAAAGVVEKGRPSGDQRAIQDALRAVQDAPARLRALLPRVDLISSPEVAGLMHHLYDAWEACVEVLREAGADAGQAGEEALPWQEHWPTAYPALHEELLRWSAVAAYESLRDRMRSELGLEPDAAAPTFTPEQLRARVKALAFRMEAEE